MSETKLKTSFKDLLLSGGTVGSLNTLAFGPFMVAYALLLGAGNLSVSFLNSLSNIGSLLSLFAVPLLQKKHFPKKTVLLLGCFATATLRMVF